MYGGFGKEEKAEPPILVVVMTTPRLFCELYEWGSPGKRVDKVGDKFLSGGKGEMTGIKPRSSHGQGLPLVKLWQSRNIGPAQLVEGSMFQLPCTGLMLEVKIALWI